MPTVDAVLGAESSTIRRVFSFGYSQTYSSRTHREGHFQVNLVVEHGACRRQGNSINFNGRIRHCHGRAALDTSPRKSFSRLTNIPVMDLKLSHMPPRGLIAVINIFIRLIRGKK